MVVFVGAANPEAIADQGRLKLITKKSLTETLEACNDWLEEEMMAR
jgi:hypothetical protein